MGDLLCVDFKDKKSRKYTKNPPAQNAIEWVLDHMCGGPTNFARDDVYATSPSEYAPMLYESSLGYVAPDQDPA